MVSLKAVKDAMLFHKVYTWQVKTRGKSLIGYQPNESMSYDASCKMLDEILSTARVEMVTIEINTAKTKGPAGDKFKILKFDVDLSSIAQPETSTGGAMPANIAKILQSQNDTILALKEELIELRYKTKIDELEKKIEGIRDESPINSFINSMGPTLAQVLPGLLLQSGKTAPPINGHDSVSESVERLRKIIPDIESVLERLADFAERDPEQVRNLIKFI